MGLEPTRKHYPQESETCASASSATVSYTHLDVYKRQAMMNEMEYRTIGSALAGGYRAAVYCRLSKMCIRDRVDTELLAVKHCQFFQTAALEIFDGFQIFFQFIGNLSLIHICLWSSLTAGLFI